MKRENLYTETKGGLCTAVTADPYAASAVRALQSREPGVKILADIPEAGVLAAVMPRKAMRRLCGPVPCDTARDKGFCVCTDSLHFRGNGDTIGV